MSWSLWNAKRNKKATERHRRRDAMFDAVVCAGGGNSTLSKEEKKKTIASFFRFFSLCPLRWPSHASSYRTALPGLERSMSSTEYAVGRARSSARSTRSRRARFLSRGGKERASEKREPADDAFSRSTSSLSSPSSLFFCFFVSHPLFSLSLALLSPKPKPKPKIRSRNFTSSPGRTRAPRSPSRCPREAPPSCAPGPTSSSSRARSRRWRS